MELTYAELALIYVELDPRLGGIFISFLLSLGMNSEWKTRNNFQTPSFIFDNIQTIDVIISGSLSFKLTVTLAKDKTFLSPYQAFESSFKYSSSYVANFLVLNLIKQMSLIWNNNCCTSLVRQRSATCASLSPRQDYHEENDGSIILLKLSYDN